VDDYPSLLNFQETINEILYFNEATKSHSARIDLLIFFLLMGVSKLLLF